MYKYINSTDGFNKNYKIRNIKPIYDYANQKYIDREIFLLKSTKNNCVLTESGFMSNEKDLANIDVDLDSYNEQMGASIWLGYRNFYLYMKEKERGGVK